MTSQGACDDSTSGAVYFLELSVRRSHYYFKHLIEGLVKIVPGRVQLDVFEDKFFS